MKWCIPNKGSISILLETDEDKAQFLAMHAGQKPSDQFERVATLISSHVALGRSMQDSKKNGGRES